MSTLINLKNITKDYENGEITTRVLKGVSFEINNGEFVGIRKIYTDASHWFFGQADERGILF